MTAKVKLFLRTLHHTYMSIKNPSTLILFAVCFTGAFAQQVDTAAVRKWHQDLEFAVSTLKAKHANLYHNISEKDFADKVTTLQRSIPLLTEVEINFEFLKLFSSIGDVHTSYTGGLGKKWLPIRVNVFSDGVFIISCPRELNMIGAKIISVDGMEINEVIQKIGTVVPHENEAGVKSYFPLFFPRPMMLKYLGIISSTDKVTLVLEKAGKRETVSITAADTAPDESAWTTVNPKMKHQLYQKNQEKAFWSKYLKDEKTYYLKCNRVVSESDGSFAKFFKEAFDSVLNLDVKKLVLDLRNCRGGDDPEYRPVLAKLLHALEAKKLNNKESFYVIISRETASAAQHLVNDIEYLANATFIGEPTSQNVHFYSDSRAFKLPNSQRDFRVAVGFLQNYVPSPFEKRTSKEPDINVGFRFSDFGTAEDPIMNYIRTH